MKFTEEIENKIQVLEERINNRNPFGIVSYRDSEDLKSLLKIIYPIIKSNKADKNDLYKSIRVLSYAAAKYEKMQRYGELVDIYISMLNCISLIFNKYNELHNKHIEILKKAITSKKRFLNCDLSDLLEISKSFLDKDKIEIYFKRNPNDFSIVKNDPIEMSKKYLKVIDIVEERMELELSNTLPYMMGRCHQVWDLKKKLLEEYKIIWRSPRELNPHIIFD